GSVRLRRGQLSCINAETRRRRGTEKAGNGMKDEVCPIRGPRSLPLPFCPLRVSMPLWLRVCLMALLQFGALFCAPARADVSAEQVNAAIKNGVSFLEKQQR